MLKLLYTLIVAIGFSISSAAVQAQTAINTTPDGIAIGGWDTVAYFTENRAAEGSPEFSHEWDGATWYFSSAENRDLFANDPEAYAPQFGGWCAYALSQGQYAAEVEPGTAWTVRDGALFLNWDEGVREKWMRNVDAGIATGHRNWERVELQILDGNARFSRKPDSPWN
jgi:YHS domain-containing protein